MLNKNNTVNTNHVPVKSHHATGNTFNYLCAQLQVSMLGYGSLKVVFLLI